MNPLNRAAKQLLGIGATHFYIDAAYETDYPFNWNTKRIANLRRVNERGLQPVVHGNFKVPLAHELVSIRNACVDYVRREVDLAAEFHAPLIVHGSQIMAHRNPKEALRDALSRFSESVGAVLEHARPRGVDIWVENLEKLSTPSSVLYGVRPLAARLQQSTCGTSGPLYDA